MWTNNFSVLHLEELLLPMKALGIVIFSHIRSRTSRPDSGLAIALTTAVISLWMVRWFSSCTPERAAAGYLGLRGAVGGLMEVSP